MTLSRVPYPVTRNPDTYIKRKIKVAQVITRMDWGGSPDIVRIICNKLDPQIYDITLIFGQTLYPSKKTKEFLSDFGNKSTVIQEFKRDINLFYDLFALFKMYWLFRREKFDIVHTHTAKAGALGRLAAKLAGVPRVIHMSHGHNFYGYFGAFGSALVTLVERFCSKFTDKIIALTELEKQDLIKFKVCEPEKITIVNSGLELDYYRNVTVDIVSIKQLLKIEPYLNLVGMISRLEPVKGAEYIVSAAKIVIEKFVNVRFLIAGEGSLREKMESEARDFGIYDKFIFLGWREDVREILSVLDVLVQPSLNEAVGRILIEAGACGIPVVAAKVGGIPEIIKDNETGILVPPKDVDNLAKGILLLLADKEKRIAMGKKAKAWVDEKFSAEKMVRDISDLYQQCVIARTASVAKQDEAICR